MLIYIQHDGTDFEFSIFDTIKNQFLEFCDNVAWLNINDFLEDYQFESSTFTGYSLEEIKECLPKNEIISLPIIKDQIIKTDDSVIHIDNLKFTQSDFRKIENTYKTLKEFFDK